MTKIHGIVAQFKNPAELLEAAHKLRLAGFKKFDCHSPFPIHGMDRAMDLKRSPVGFIVAAFALAGGIIGLSLQTWVHSIEYPLIISGKPFFAWQGYIVVTFAMTILLGAFGAVFGMFFLNRIPRFHHPHFYSDILDQFSDDGFFITIDAQDSEFHSENTAKLLTTLGSSKNEMLEER
jgi:hypothetical protein